MGGLLLLSPPWDLWGFSRVGSHWWSLISLMGWSYPLGAAGSEAAMEVQRQAWRAGWGEPTHSTARGKVAPELSLNGAPGWGQGVGVSRGCSGPSRPISAL